ncbi:MAG: diguanylate cyclase [Candidatus Diapherotrites archaeon]
MPPKNARHRRSVSTNSERLLGQQLIQQLSPFQSVQALPIRKAITGYTHHRSVARLGRSAITNPFDFNIAENVALRRARDAQRIFNSPSFRRDFKRLKLDVQQSVVEKYRHILKEASAIRLIAKKERLVHDRTPAVFNRKAFDALLYSRLNRPNRQPFSVGMIDLDYFGKINKKFGQESGNFVLMRFSEKLAEVCARHGGFSGRVGGEEYQFFLPVSPTKAKEIMDSLRVRFARITSTRVFRQNLQQFHPEGSAYHVALKQWNNPVQFTAAVMGKASLDKSYPKPGILLSAVDAAMQKGKRAGRARTILEQIPMGV